MKEITKQSLILRLESLTELVVLEGAVDAVALKKAEGILSDVKSAVRENIADGSVDGRTLHAINPPLRLRTWIG